MTAASTSKTISIVIPAYNEEDSLRPLRAAIKAAIDGKLDYEVVLVDDGSKDRTREVAREIAKEDPRFRLVALAKNTGETAAGWAGMREARGDLVCIMDADLQNDPVDLPKMVALIGEWDVVCGWRKKRGDGDNVIRRVSSRVANWVRNALSSENIHDSGCTYRVFKRECVEGLQLFKGMHRFLPTLFKAQGWKVTECEVANHPRQFGVSKYRRLEPGVPRVLRLARRPLDAEPLDSPRDRRAHGPGIRWSRRHRSVARGRERNGPRRRAREQCHPRGGELIRGDLSHSRRDRPRLRRAFAQNEIPLGASGVFAYNPGASKLGAQEDPRIVVDFL